MEWGFPYAVQAIDLMRRSTNETSDNSAVRTCLHDMQNKEFSPEGAIQAIPVCMYVGELL